jgi:aarF domain-containing kinase
VLLTAAGGTLAAAVGIGIADDVKHAYSAARRTGRVVGTLAVCINDYRITLEYTRRLKMEVDDKDKLGETKEREEKEMEAKELLRQCHKRCAERTLDVLERNGSVFIKLGQHLSSMK